MKLQHRIALAVGIASTLSVAVALSGALYLVAREETRALDEVLNVHCNGRVDALNGGQSPASVVTPQGPTVPELFGHRHIHTTILHANGAMLARSGASAHTLPSPRQLLADGVGTFDLHDGAEPSRATVRRGSGGLLVLCTGTREGVDEDVRFQFSVSLALFVSVALVTAFAGRRVGARIAADVERIAAAARAVASGELDRRVGEHAMVSDDTRALGRDLDGMIAKLAESLAAQQTFIANAAHELRSPLATLRGELQLALRRERSAESYKEVIEKLLIEVESLSELTDGLLDLAREEAPQSGPPRDCAVSEALESALRHARFTRKGPAPRTEGDLALRVGVDRLDLARILRNLLENADLHGGGGATVQLAVRGSTAHISVSDAGPGLAPELAERLFLPFARSDDARADGRPGTGLGLAIARRLARRHGGDLVLAPAARGARFELSVPLAVAAPSENDSVARRMSD